ncbi:MerR family transcriptional regulator [Pseudonocardia kongjuensis]|uniref:MerR family transcriptional regulator n=1 Tax=Pseudonocardia kongjuensis TaxID=102227 RepID=A0ABN1XUJ6_9PSEU
MVMYDVCHIALGGHLPEFRIDELAQASGVSVRNIRAYQDSGILPPPKRQGRVGIYSDDHLARLRLIAGLLKRGYTATNIGELLRAWENGRDLSTILGLEQIVTGIADVAPSAFLSADQLRELLNTAGAAHDVSSCAVQAGLVEHDGDRYRAPNTRLLHAVAALLRAGAPAQAVFAFSAQLQDAVDTAIHKFVTAIADDILRDRQPDWMPTGTEIPQLAEYVSTITTQTESVAAATVTYDIGRYLDAALGEYIARIMPHLQQRETQ